jgi:hypothetical protein
MRKITLILIFGLLVSCQVNRSEVSTALPTRPAPTPGAILVGTPVSSPTYRPTSTPTVSPPLPTLTLTLPSAAIRLLNGDFWNQVARLESNMPRAGSDGYVPPSAAEMATFRDILGFLDQGDISSAVMLAAANHYELLQYTDRGDGGQESYLLRELKPIQKDWGLYAFRLGSDSPVIVEAPHPLADDETPWIALQIYRALDGGALLIAGAHRDANVDGLADVAHSPDTIFQTIHQSLLTSERVVLQIHGFASAKHPGYPQVVLGHDQGIHDELIQQLTEALSAAGLRVGVCDGEAWHGLCGGTNIQSSVMTQGVFIHIEMDETARADAQPLISALQQVLGP